MSFSFIYNSHRQRTDAPATGAANIGGLTSHAYSREPKDKEMYTGFYLGFTVWGRSLERPKTTSFLGGSGGMPPRKIFEMNMR